MNAKLQEFKKLHGMLGFVCDFQEHMQKEYGVSDFTKLDRTNPAVIEAVNKFAVLNIDKLDKLFE